jgi:phage terminase large subunit-like protein
VLIEYKNALIHGQPSAFLEYVNEIEAGNIVVGNDMAMQVENLIRDLENSWYVYDTKDAMWRMRFIEGFCKHTKSPFYGQPFILELWQKAFIETFYSFKWSPEGYRAYYEEDPVREHLRRFKKAILMVARKNGKPIDINTPIQTPNGLKRLGELELGDYVLNEEGQPVRIIAATDVMHDRQCYKLVFGDGEEIIADKDHIWTVCTQDEQVLNITTEGLYYFFLTPNGEYRYVVLDKPIVNVLHVPSAPVRCIEVEGSGLFLVGEKGTVTHNSSLCSALGFTELMIGLPGSDIVCSSNDDKQARIIFDETGVMRQLFDPFGKRGTHKNLQAIFNYNTNSKMFRLSDRTSNKEGRNIDGAILDESHEMVDNIIAKSVEQSQSTKDEPWFINITTEGFVNEGYLDNETKYARMVLAGDIEDPTLLSFLYTQDSENEIWQDERTWMKSNPSLGHIKKRKYIIDQMNKARHDKGERLFMLTKDFNIKTKVGEAWLLPEEIENPATFDTEDLRGTIGLGGVDLSETTDLANAKMLIMRPGDNTKYVLNKYFIPESKVEAGSKEDKQNYLEWAKQGLIEITPGNENNFSLITKWFVSLVKNYNIRPFKIGLDRWQAQYLIKELEETGFDCAKITFDKKIISNPMKLAEADLKSKLVNYNNNPIDRYCLSNTGIKIDNMGLIFPVKVQGLANKRIDGAVTLILCYCMYQWNRTEYLQIIR